MDQYTTPPAGSGGAANIPSFPTSETVPTPPDHQLEASTAAGEREPEAGEVARGAAARARDRLNERIPAVADTFQRASRRLAGTADRLEAAGGSRARAGAMAHGAADALESAAGYLHSNDVQGLRRDLERQVREHPLQTLAVGLTAGWLVGKILR